MSAFEDMWYASLHFSVAFDASFHSCILAVCGRASEFRLATALSTLWGIAARLFLMLVCRVMVTGNSVCSASSSSRCQSSLHRRSA